MVADPMLRAGNPETVAESKRTGVCPAAAEAHTRTPANITIPAKELRAETLMFHVPYSDLCSAAVPGGCPFDKLRARCGGVSPPLLQPSKTLSG
jgi:hypothetical protein